MHGGQTHRIPNADNERLQASLTLAELENGLREWATRGTSEPRKCSWITRRQCQDTASNPRLQRTRFARHKQPRLRALAGARRR